MIFNTMKGFQSCHPFKPICEFDLILYAMSFLPIFEYINFNKVDLSLNEDERHLYHESRNNNI